MNDRSARTTLILGGAGLGVAIIVALFGDNLAGRFFQDPAPVESNSLATNVSLAAEELEEPAYVAETNNAGAGIAGNAMVPPEPSQAPQTANDAESGPERPSPKEQAVEDPPPTEARPRPNLSRNCPSPSIVLSFRRPGNVSSAFNPVTDPTHVRMINCEPSGWFVTRFPADQGSIDGTGKWSAEDIRFEFGYRSSFAGIHPVTCSVAGSGNGSGTYSGSLTCYDDDEHVLNVKDVSIRL